MASVPLKINRFFGKEDFNLTEYKLASYDGAEYLVYNEWKSNEVRMKVEDIQDKDMTASIIRQLKSQQWKECFSPQCIIEYLLDFDPTCFRNVEKLHMLEDDYEGTTDLEYLKLRFSEDKNE